MIPALSGSAHEQSTNRKLIASIAQTFPNLDVQYSDVIYHLPLFAANLQNKKLVKVEQWKQAIRDAKKVLIVTPEYLHNLPASIKNALEWLAATGELDGKSVVPIVFTPHAPRGEKTQQSLNWSLKALNANVEGSLLLHINDLAEKDNHFVIPNEIKEILQNLLS